jgi:signal transduction histidine kinase
VEGLTLWEWLRRVNPLIWDGLLAVLVFLVNLAGALAVNQSGPRGRVEIGFGAGAILLLALASAPLVWRRRAPLATLVVVAVVTATYVVLRHPYDFLFALPIAAYTAAANRDRRVVLTTVLPVAVASGLTIPLQERLGPIETVVNLVFLVGLPILFGRIAYSRRRRIERDRERAAYDAVADERARIARELHDVVAHAMGVMVVQAGAARVVMDRDPSATSTALRRIEDTGRMGLAEMRRLVGILTTDAEIAALVPQPGLDRLEELLDTMRGAGLPVECVMDGAPGNLPLPPGVDLTAYRVVQEALTNALKHAGPAHARVLISYRDDALELEIADDGRGPLPEGLSVPGHGLIGMRERVALFGGFLVTETRPGGGFLVRATIPVHRDAT